MSPDVPVRKSSFQYPSLSRLAWGLCFSGVVALLLAGGPQEAGAAIDKIPIPIISVALTALLCGPVWFPILLVTRSAGLAQYAVYLVCSALL